MKKIKLHIVITYLSIIFLHFRELNKLFAPFMAAKQKKKVIRAVDKESELTARGCSALWIQS